MSRGRGALILGHNRQELLDQTVAAIRPQVDTVMVIDNASDPKLTVPEGVGTMFIPDQPPNISKFWNIGFKFMKDWYSRSGMHYDVAFLCDDALAPAGWFDAVIAAMRGTGAVIGCSNPFGGEHAPVLKTAPDRDIMGRMPGWAWIMDGDRAIEADERLLWWYQDTCLDWEARKAGGMVMIGGFPVINMEPNRFTNSIPAQGEQAGRDAATFVEIYGYKPW